MHKLDKDGDHRLSNETVFMNVLHSRCKSWRTYTLSYYDLVLKQLVKIATMEAEIENGKYCKLSLRQINKIINDKFSKEDGTNSENYIFNHTCTKYDEYSGNRIGISAVYGENFINERTAL